MGFFSGFKKLLGGGGGSASSSNTTQNEVTVNTQTDVNIDLLPLGEVLAESQVSAMELGKDIAKIELINSELDRQQNQKVLKQFDTYIENAKNGLVLSIIVAGLLYTYKKSKKRGGKNGK